MFVSWELQIATWSSAALIATSHPRFINTARRLSRITVLSHRFFLRQTVRSMSSLKVEQRRGIGQAATAAVLDITGEASCLSRTVVTLTSRQKFFLVVSWVAPEPHVSGLLLMRIAHLTSHIFSPFSHLVTRTCVAQVTSLACAHHIP